MLHRFAVSVLFVAAALSAQTTHVVQGGGAALQQAINAAAPGDILDVLSGSYSPVVATRGLHVALRAGAQVLASFPSTGPAFAIASLPAGDVFVLRGGGVQGIAITNCAGDVVCSGVRSDAGSGGSTSRIDNCTGMVALQHVDALTVPTFGSPDVGNCAQVSCTACALPRTTVTSSAVSFTDVSIRPYGGSFPAGSAPSLHVVSGDVAIAGGRIDGGVAASVAFHESGIQLDQGSVVLSRAARVQESILFSSPTVPAIATNGGTLRIDPSVTLVGLPPIAGPAVVTLAATPGLAFVRAAGSTSFRVDATAEPSSLAFTLIGFAAPPVQLPFGMAWLDPTSPVLDVSVTPASGSYSFTRSLVGVPPFFVLVLQPAALSTAGTIDVGTPVRFVWD